MIAAYLSFNGNTEEAFNFYESALGGKIANLQRFGDMPPQGAPMSDDDKKKIMHVHLDTPLGILMGSDHMEYMGGKYVVGNNFSLSVHPQSEEQARKIFEGLSQGANVLMPMDKTFWGAYFGMLIDKFGLKWMVNYQIPK